FLAGQGQPLRQAQVGATQQALEYPVGEAAGNGGSRDECTINAAVRVIASEGVDQAVIPAGMNQAETPGVEKQRHLLEPVEKVAPVGRMALELPEGLQQQALMMRRVLAHMASCAL